MQFVLMQAEASKLLNTVSSCTGNHPNLPILSNVLLHLNEDGVLRVTGTDLETEIKAKMKLSNLVFDEGKVTVNSKKLSDIVRGFSGDEELSFTLNDADDKLIVKRGRSRYTLATLPPSDFPDTDEVDKEIKAKLTIPQNILHAAIMRVQHAMANHDVRYYLNGIHCEINGDSLILVATDGHRLAKTTVSGLNVRTVDKNYSFIIGRKAVAELLKVIDKSSSDLISVKSTNSNFIATTESAQLVTKLIDGRFPDWRRVIPGQTSSLLTVNVQELKRTLTRASILTNEKFKGVQLELKDNELVITARNPEHEQSEDVMAVDFQGDALTIGFNVAYVLEALNVYSGEMVTLGFNSSSEAATVTDADLEADEVQVLMPIRI